MTFDPRDVLWNKYFEIYYDCFFYELCAENLLKRWQTVDDVTKVLIAITTSTSAIAGWSLWEQPGYRSVWLALAGSGAILSIIHTTLSVATRIKEWEQKHNRATQLRVKIENSRSLMEINPNFDLDELSIEYYTLRKTFAEMLTSFNNDILLTVRLKIDSQAQLDTFLSNEK